MKGILLCKKCMGTGKDRTKLPIRAKVPGTSPGLDRYKLVQPLCSSCGGTGESTTIPLPSAPH